MHDRKPIDATFPEIQHLTSSFEYINVNID